MAVSWSGACVVDDVDNVDILVDVAILSDEAA